MKKKKLEVKKMQVHSFFKDESAITLIALIITIIVLLILARSIVKCDNWR